MRGHSGSYPLPPPPPARCDLCADVIRQESERIGKRHVDLRATSTRGRLFRARTTCARRLRRSHSTVPRQVREVTCVNSATKQFVIPAPPRPGPAWPGPVLIIRRCDRALLSAAQFGDSIRPRNVRTRCAYCTAEMRGLRIGPRQTQIRSSFNRLGSNNR